MGQQTGVLEICNFLEKAKNLISVGRLDFVPRRKNMQWLAKQGLTIADAKEELLELVVDDYYKGPKNDFTHPGEIWEFKKIIVNEPVYIKIKIAKENNIEVLKCLGFHDDEFAPVSGGVQNEEIL